MSGPHLRSSCLDILQYFLTLSFGNTAYTSVRLFGLVNRATPGHDQVWLICILCLPLRSAPLVNVYSSDRRRPVITQLRRIIINIYYIIILNILRSYIMFLFIFYIVLRKISLLYWNYIFYYVFFMIVCAERLERVASPLSLFIRTLVNKLLFYRY